MANTFYLYPVDGSKILKAVKEVKPKKSSWLDNLRSETKKNIHEILAPLSYMINKCFQDAQFPKLFKTGVGKPLNKDDDIQDIVHSQPITLISDLVKVMEKILKYILINFLDKKM